MPQKVDFGRYLPTVALNIFLHLTNICANSFNFFDLLETDRRSVETLFFIRDFYCEKNYGVEKRKMTNNKLGYLSL